MFLKRHNNDDFPDLSIELRDEISWVPGTLRTFEYLLNITALAFDPTSRILAAGTSSGTIHIFGGAGVESKLTLPEPVSVKFLSFSQLTFTILCIDGNNCLHAWDLAVYGRPKLLTSQRFHDAVSCLALSPSHSHAFVTLASGEVRAYDVECCRVSPYKIPNLWDLYEEKLRQTGIAHQASPESRLPIDIAVHPRDLNLLFIAYEGGIILCDLKEQATIRTYELVLRPGAPGGEGYGSKDLLLHRRVPVTAIAIHPAGHFFAVGHLDGSIAFWAVEDEDQPLAVRTLDSSDVNIVDAAVLEQHLDSPPPSVLRESIFKLAWCGFSNSTDPRGGETALAILGGTPVGDAPGLTVEWLPAFNPDAPAAGPGAVGIPPALREAMRSSTNPVDAYFYETRGVVQDFYLTPTRTPHLSGAFDPDSIVFILEGPGGSRVTEAYEYPPQAFLSRGKEEKADAGADLDVEEDLAKTLADMKVSDEPVRLLLPPALECGSAGVSGGQLLRLDTHVYQRLVDWKGLRTPTLTLKGGRAWCDELDVSELRLAKYEPHRLLVTYNQRDATVRFFDVSAQLLIAQRPNALESDYPAALSHLTLSTSHVTTDPALAGRASDAFLRGEAAVANVNFVSVGEDTEAAITMSSGEVVLFRTRHAQQASRILPPQTDQELVTVQPRVLEDNLFAPYLVIVGRAPSTACALTREGFAAVAYADGSLVIANIRRNAVVQRMRPDSRRQSALGLHRREDSSADAISALLWVVSPLAEEPTTSLRLLALRSSGTGRIYTIDRDGGAGSAKAAPLAFEGASEVLNNGIFVVDSKTGGTWRGGERPGSKPLLVSVGARGARCNVDITGERIGKIDWSIGPATSAAVVEKLGSHALLVFNATGESAAYSLPRLELMHTHQLTAPSTIPPSPDTTGDYVAWARHATAGVMRHASYATLFAGRRPHAGLPDVEYVRGPQVPQPQPVSAGPETWSAWLGGLTGRGTMTGEQIDAMLAGPDRPPPRPRAQPPRSPGLAGAFGTGVSAAGVADAAEGARAGLADRLGAALNERGQALSELEQHFNALEEGSRSMVAQAKRLATQQTAKGWFNFSSSS
ncbi:uncharacterized protein SCHCODRAFT_02566174 [Schizophyllum commune H4-8]|uniref:Lethal giant larvae (Lgl)-like C-terminal domain-containing protein n=1 Tax=Schizophyllum commune (strain H4-8 / FGSC 9210) TaxID=578458 RepID=D8PQA0_SCHCM|nr:uncharacterized protein SCHCODRAFT_02566174 [Schizophyllum commune H4-8]KAI5898227.1 hypothetical protein SCHCODRAFT_02566174 [Schizophyllum commune H4-8]